MITKSPLIKDTCQVRGASEYGVPPCNLIYGAKWSTCQNLIIFKQLTLKIVNPSLIKWLQVGHLKSESNRTKFVISNITDYYITSVFVQ